MVGWALLVLAGIVWVTRDVVPERAATRVTASAALTMWHGGTDAQLRQAFAAAQKSSAVDTNLIVEPNPAVHGESSLTVTADTPEQAQSGLTTLTDAIKAALPAAAREGFRAMPDTSTYPAPNETTRRLGLAFRIVAMILIVAAQVLIVLGSYGQIGTLRAGLLAKLALPFIFLLLAGGGSSGGRRTANVNSYYIPPGVVSFMLVLLPLSIIPLLLILWLTRKSKASRDTRNTPGRSQ